METQLNKENMFKVRFENLILIPTFLKLNGKPGTKPFAAENVSVDFDVVKFARKESQLLNLVRH
jgi:hypothetical protein